MPLSINDFQDQIRDTLNEDTWFAQHNIVWHSENELDIEQSIINSITEQGIHAIIMTPDLAYIGQSHASTNAFKVNQLIMQITEVPIINRAGTNPATALDAACRASQVLMDKYSTVMVPVDIKQTARGKSQLVATATHKTSIIVCPDAVTTHEGQI